jgi:serine/threonine protein kinase
MSLAATSKLGPYEVIAPLGAGGMGEVYRARDTRLERTVAIKVLPQHLSSNPELKQRLEREAKAISSLNHPHICTLYDIGSQDGVDFLVMEYLEGETLDRRIQRGALPLDEVIILAIALANALDKAHRKGILHRDLKPGNVMLTKNGPKLLDFGLAKTTLGMSGSSETGALTPSTPTMTIASFGGTATPMTEKGSLLGTFQYMAPEVLQGAEADARSDIFSFGCMLYEMVTGRRAFEGKSQFSVLGAILDKEPERISSVLPTSPARLDETVRRCLAKNPDERYGCMHDVAIQLKAVAETTSRPEPPTKVAEKPSAKSWPAWAAAGIAAVVALGFAAAYLSVYNRPGPVVQTSILPPTGVSFVTMVPSAGPAVLAPDGSRLAFSARDDKGKVLLYIRPLGSVTTQALAGTEEATYPFWSPDSRQVGFFGGGKLKIVSASGGPVQNLCEAASARGGAWSSKGVIVFAPRVTGPLQRISVSGGTPEPASKLDTSSVENSHRWPFFLPDGEHFLYWGRSSVAVQQQVLKLSSLGSLDAKIVAKGVATATYASGYLLFLREQTLLAQSFDARHFQLTGEPVVVAEHVAINANTGAPIFSASQTGNLVYQSSDATGSWDLLWYTRDGKQTGSVTQQDRYYYPALSPDGSRLAASLFNGVQGTSDIWIFDLKRATRTRLTFNPGTQIRAVWSADGKTLFYAANRTGKYQIYSRAADGSGSEQIVVESKDADSLPESVSSDGRYLIFYAAFTAANDDPAGSAIRALSLSGGGAPFTVLQNTFRNVGPAISPNGKWILYQSDESSRYEIYITPFPGGGAKWQVSTNGGVDAQWRGDSKELYFLDPSDNLMAVDVETSGGAPRLGTPHALFQALGVQRQVGSYVASSDGKKFLINSGNAKEGTEPLTLVLNWPALVKR